MRTRHPSFSADLGKGVWYDHAKREGGGVKEFKARLGLNGDERRTRTISAVYPYYDEERNLLYEVVRYEPKDFGIRRPNDKGEWVYKLNGARLVLYRLPEVLWAEIVFIVEGKKDSDRLHALGFVATCNPFGAGKWRAEYNPYLAGKQVVILPDNDEPGEQHALSVARSLLPVAVTLKLIRLPGA